MMLERMRNFEMLGPRPCPRRLDLGNGGHDETEVVEHLRIRATMRAAMKRQVVASGGQVRVIRVGLPHQAHAEDPRIILRGAFHVGNLERKMAKSSIFYHCDGFQPAMVSDPSDWSERFRRRVYLLKCGADLKVRVIRSRRVPKSRLRYRDTSGLRAMPGPIE